MSYLFQLVIHSIFRRRNRFKMKSLLKLIETNSFNTLLLLISISLVLQDGCSVSRIERISEPPTKLVPT